MNERTNERTPFVYKSSFSITAYEGHKKSLDPYQKWTSSLFFSKLIRTVKRVSVGELKQVGFESEPRFHSVCAFWKKLRADIQDFERPQH